MVQIGYQLSEYRSAEEFKSKKQFMQPQGWRIHTFTWRQDNVYPLLVLWEKTYQEG